jgi:hypothetical protein
MRSLLAHVSAKRLAVVFLVAWMMIQWKMKGDLSLAAEVEQEEDEGTPRLRQATTGARPASVLPTPAPPLTLSATKHLMSPPLGWSTWCTLGACGQETLEVDLIRQESWLQRQDKGGGGERRHLSPADLVSMSPGARAQWRAGWKDPFHDVCDELLIRQNAAAMVESGMLAAGWRWIWIDDCWADMDREPARNGSADRGPLQPDPARFPDLPTLIDDLHALGFLVGIYTSATRWTCNKGMRPKRIPGSLHHYEADIARFHDWAVDGIKVDWCDWSLDAGLRTLLQEVFALAVLAEYGAGQEPVLLAHCRGGPGDAGCRRMAHLHRISHDYHDTWASTERVAALLADTAPAAQPPFFADGDFLLTGGAGCGRNSSSASPDRCPGQSEGAYRIQAALWTIASSPLLLATDLRLPLSLSQQQVVLSPLVVEISSLPWSGTPMKQLRKTVRVRVVGEREREREAEREREGERERERGGGR